ncbi:NifU N-terminal domain-containing protein, partial [Staphylococcus epidermidis]|uniref:NifU N-terminal domain-containing protein n=1 Tax=Staphylococcus epidermidis TaxID=1282 RepID=UPI0030C0B8CF
ENQPQFINDLLKLEGVKSIFYVMDFLAIDKQPKANWDDVLPHITSTLNNESSYNQEPQPDEHYGEVRAEVLMFKGIPYQLKITTNK